MNLHATKKGGYTISNGIVKQILLGFLTLSSQPPPIGAEPLVVTDKVKIIPVVYQNDSTALKPGLMIDQNKKVAVGIRDPSTSNCFVDYAFVKSHPILEPEFLKKNFIVEANVSFLNCLDDSCSSSVACNYLTKEGKTGPQIKEQFLREIKLLQMCKNCLEKVPTKDHVLSISLKDAEALCNSFCEPSWNEKQVCAECSGNYESFHPCVRPCESCIRDGIQCIKIVVLVLTSDCEEGNKKAMESIINDLQMNDADPCFSSITCLPDCVHVGKSIKYSFANWFILLNKERANLAILNTLRDDVSWEIRSSLANA